MSGTTRLRLVSVALAASALLSGCVLLDGREELRIEPGALLASSILRLRIDGNADRAEIVVDGEVVGDSVPVAADLSVDVSHLAEGRHTLQARSVGGVHHAWSRDIPLTVDRTPPRVRFTPPGGDLDETAGPTIEISFSEPVVPSPAVGVLFDYGTTVPFERSTSADGQRITVHFASALPYHAVVLVSASATDLAGNVGTVVERYTMPRHPPLNLALHVNGGSSHDEWVNGVAVVEVAANPSSGPFTGASLRYGDVVLATASGGPPWTFTWDTTTWPEGAYRLTVTVPGWDTGTFRYLYASPEPDVIVHVDRTAPALVGCRTELGGPEISRRERLYVTFDEQLASAVVNGAYAGPTAGSSSLAANEVVLEPEYVGDPPFQLATNVVAIDLAGNVTDAGRACTFDVPRWFRPFGEHPVDSTAGPIRASELAFGTLPSNPWWDPHVRARVLSVGAPGSPGAGELRAYEGLAPGPLAPLGPPLNVDPGSVAAELSMDASRDSVVWIERVGGGAGHVHARHWDGNAWAVVERVTNGDPARDARHPAVGGSTNGAGPVAWSEETADGRALRFAAASTYMPATLLASPGNVLDFPSVSFNGVSPDPLTRGSTSVGVAYLETGADGIARLRVATWMFGSWAFIGDALNRSRRSAASEPALSSSTTFARVAWVEEGQVLSREYDAWTATWSDPVVLNADVTRRARSPRLVGPSMVLFLEEGPGGETVQLREWDGADWIPLVGPQRIVDPTFVAADFGGAPAIAWIDGAGAVRLEVGNWYP